MRGCRERASGECRGGEEIPQDSPTRTMRRMDGAENERVRRVEQTAICVALFVVAAFGIVATVRVAQPSTCKCKCIFDDPPRANIYNTTTNNFYPPASGDAQLCRNLEKWLCLSGGGGGEAGKGKPTCKDSTFKDTELYHDIFTAIKHPDAEIRNMSGEAACDRIKSSGNCALITTAEKERRNCGEILMLAMYG